jgi:hypothetical protein
MNVKSVTTVNTIAELKARPVAPDALVLVVGKATAGDGLGGFYQWDAASAAAEDMAYLNVIASDGPAAGRWVKLFIRNRLTGGPARGTLTINGAFRTFFVGATTDAHGDARVVLTEDGTVGGVPLFSEILYVDCICSAPASTPQAAYQTFYKSGDPAKNTVVFGVHKARHLTLLKNGKVDLDLSYSPYEPAAAGLPVKFQISGRG